MFVCLAIDHNLDALVGFFFFFLYINVGNITLNGEHIRGNVLDRLEICGSSFCLYFIPSSMAFD
jgi:hypothetical protein